MRIHSVGLHKYLFKPLSFVVGSGRSDELLADALPLPLMVYGKIIDVGQGSFGVVLFQNVGGQASNDFFIAYGDEYIKVLSTQYFPEVRITRHFEVLHLKDILKEGNERAKSG